MISSISSDIVVAFSQCKRKAFLLLRGDQRDNHHEYDRIVDSRAVENRTSFLANRKIVSGISTVDQDNGFNYDRHEIRSGNLQASCDLVAIPHSRNRSDDTAAEPYLVIGTRSISVDQRLRLAFAGFTIAKIARRRPKCGFIVPLKQLPRRIRLESLYPAIESTINGLNLFKPQAVDGLPPVILNEHCPTCPFRRSCQNAAEREDSLTLLERATPKLIERYRRKGIFTINQLSYAYRPRRRKKRASSPMPGFNLELQALAIRTNRVHVCGEVPNLPEQPVELFLDIEGVPDERYEYLIGVIVKTPCQSEAFSFWADSPKDAAMIYKQLVDCVSKYPDAPIYHYGSFETRVLTRASQVYSLDLKTIIDRLVNINTIVFGRIYFPTRSNRLKDIGRFVGAEWESLNDSGLESIVWRYQWEASQSSRLKQQLTNYNINDCHAVHRLQAFLIGVAKDSRTSPRMAFADEANQQCTDHGKSIHEELDLIIELSHAEQRRRRIRYCERRHDVENINPCPKGHPSRFRIPPRCVNHVVSVRRRLKCPQCRGSQRSMEPTNSAVEHTIADLVFTSSGVRKSMTKFKGVRSHCPNCRRDYPPLGVPQCGGFSFGHRFKAWCVYQRVSLHLPYAAISDSIEHLFMERISPPGIVNFIKQIASKYASTETSILKRILSSSFVHVDETKMSIQGVTNYVWSLTDGVNTVFRLTESRESNLVQNILSGFQGVLISDFYGGYDAFACRQQKCLVHLLRDLNDDLWKEPFNIDLERFASSFRDLVVPIFEDVDRYGLKRRYLHKHCISVNRWYSREIEKASYSSDTVLRYQKRFERYRGSLFTFLDSDGIPWNNNAAERAIRHFAVQRKISGSFYRSLADQYLRLLGIAQTCRFQKKSFLRFLLSGKMDIDEFKELKRRKTSASLRRSNQK